MNDLLLLSTLLDGPAHGYVLKKRIGLITGQREMHNNILYPLLKRFVQAGWVTRKTTPGERGQIRERYALTAKGKQQLLRRLGDFSTKDASSPQAFQMRVGLFGILDEATREKILTGREIWLRQRAEKLANLSTAMDLGEWGSEVVAFLRSEVETELNWSKELRTKILRRERRRFQTTRGRSTQEEQK
jgi:DNA-binding PadR family transcriptional regulator